MKTPALVLALLAAALAPAVAAPFAEPQQHPASRYESGWQKNPFTLKTAPVAVTKESFAKDLALAGWRQAGDDTIVILVNTKTREYSRLKNQEPSADGTKVAGAHLQDRRSDTYVELERNGEKAVVRFDESFQKQMAAQGAAPKTNPTPPAGNRPPTGGAPGMTGGAATPMPVNQPPNITAPNIKPNAPSGGVMPAPANVSAPGVALPPLPTQPSAGGDGNVPTVQRRRMNTMPQPAPR